MQARAVRRAPLPITADDELHLQQVRESELSGASISAAAVSQAALLHAIYRAGRVSGADLRYRAPFEAGLTAVRNVALEAGYAELAVEQAAEEPGRREEARRRRPSWADEL